MSPTLRRTLATRYSRSDTTHARAVFGATNHPLSGRLPRDRTRRTGHGTPLKGCVPVRPASVGCRMSRLGRIVSINVPLLSRQKQPIRDPG